MGLISRCGKIENRKVSGLQAAVGLILFASAAVQLTFAVWKFALWISDYTGRYTKYDAMIVDAGIRNGVDPDLLKAVIWRESRFDRTAIGAQGEVGLMQIMPRYAAQEWADAHKVSVPSKGTLTDPRFNIEIGSWYLGRALKRWKQYDDCIVLALCEYNAGLTRAEAWKPLTKNGSVMERIQIASTRGYVNDILVKYQEYQRESAEKTAKKQ